jgi:hypothetical protein
MEVVAKVPIDLEMVLKYIEECRSDYALNVIIGAAKGRLMDRIEEEKRLDELRKFWEECN